MCFCSVVSGTIWLGEGGVAWRGEDVRIRIITKLADRESGAQTSKTSQARKTLLACRRAALIRA